MFDIFSMNEFYKKAYSKARSSKDKPRTHQDFNSTYFITPEDVDVKLHSKFISGMTGDEFKPYYDFIAKNIPMDNMKIILRKNNKEIFPCFVFLTRIDTISSHVYNADSSFEMMDNYLMLACLYGVLKSLSEKNTYIACQNVEYKNRRTGRAMTNEVVYVSRVRGDRKIVPYFGEKIDWKHSWSVVGHYRSIKGIGKNRNGNRCEFGKTWVIPCIKGNGDFVEKIRMVV